jgi:hypothetical protein
MVETKRVKPIGRQVTECIAVTPEIKRKLEEIKLFKRERLSDVICQLLIHYNLNCANSKTKSLKRKLKAGSKKVFPSTPGPNSHLLAESCPPLILKGGKNE